MDESKKKKEYLKKLEKRKLKKSQEYKALAFSTGITLVFALLFGFFGYSFITGEVRVIPLIIAAAFLAEGLAQGLFNYSPKNEGADPLPAACFYSNSAVWASPHYIYLHRKHLCSRSRLHVD